MRHTRRSLGSKNTRLGAGIDRASFPFPLCAAARNRGPATARSPDAAYKQKYERFAVRLTGNSRCGRQWLLPLTSIPWPFDGTTIGFERELVMSGPWRLPRITHFFLTPPSFEYTRRDGRKLKIFYLTRPVFPCSLFGHSKFCRSKIVLVVMKLNWKS